MGREKHRGFVLLKFYSSIILKFPSIKQTLSNINRKNNEKLSFKGYKNYNSSHLETSCKRNYFQKLTCNVCGAILVYKV